VNLGLSRAMPRAENVIYMYHICVVRGKNHNICTSLVDSFGKTTSWCNSFIVEKLHGQVSNSKLVLFTWLVVSAGSVAAEH
jgi:hypothetical protein